MSGYGTDDICEICETRKATREITKSFFHCDHCSAEWMAKDGLRVDKKDWEELAAILEYQQGLDRHEAELSAWKTCVKSAERFVFIIQEQGGR